MKTHSFTRSGVALAALLVTLSFSSALAGDCVAVPMHADNGTYQGCEIIHGMTEEFRDAGTLPEAACPKVCESLNEIDALAAESRELDEKAGFH